MSHNIELVQLLIERGFNQGDLSVADEVCARRFTEHDLEPTELPGPEILKSQIRAARSQLVGLRLTIEDIVAVGDKVWVQIAMQGTDSRSGKPVTMSELDVCRFENGLMVEHWGIPDRFALVHELGQLPQAA